MKAYFPSKRTKLLWQIRVTAVGVVLIGITCFIRPLRLYFWAVAAVVLLSTASVLAYLPFFLKNFKLSLCENALIIESGVLIRHERVMPYPRMLYTEQRKTPLAGRLGVSSLVFRATKAAIFTPEFQDTDVCEILEALRK